MDIDLDIGKKLDLAISRMPLVHRMIARRAVMHRATKLAEAKGAPTIGEEEIARAFFSEVPSPFRAQMMVLLSEVGIDYQRYGLG